jgi:Holliday junction resolvase
MNNKTIGNRFEQDLCEILSEYGFWVHNMMMSKAGQPADIIAARNGKAYLIDAKVCSNNEFPLSRVEENQTLAMDLWADRGNGQGWFALKLNDEVYMLTNLVIKAYANSQSKMSAKDICDCGMPIERWVKKCK